jgi:MFS family permease
MAATRQQDRVETGRLALLTANDRMRRLWSAHLVSVLGDGLYVVALPWMVYEHTHSGAATTATVAIGAVPYLPVGLISGVYVDRNSRRLILIAADLTRAVALVAITLVLVVHGFALWLAILLSAMLPIAGRFFAPAQRASVPALVQPMELMGANALMEAAGNTASIGGPALAGVLIALWGPLPLLFVDAASFVASALLLTGLPELRPAARQRRSVLAEMREGAVTLWRLRTLRVLLIIATLVIPCFAIVPALLPVWTQRSLGNDPHAYGVLTSLFFVGALAGSIGIVRWGNRVASGTVFVASTLCIGLVITGLGLSSRLVPGGLALFVLGGTVSCLNVSGTSLLQRFAPRQALGRVLSAFEAFSWSLRPEAVLGAGVIADRVGVYSTLIGVGIIVAAAGAIAGCSGALRGVNQPAQPAEEVKTTAPVEQVPVAVK